MSPFCRLHLIELRHVAADEGDSLLDRLAAVRHGLELGGVELTAYRAAAVQSALFVLPDDHFERVARDDIVLGERLRDFDRRESSRRCRRSCRPRARSRCANRRAAA